jgi:hypothetical protein
MWSAMKFITGRWPRPLAVTVLLSLLLGAPAGARAWSQQGHRITGLVAEQLLTPAARAGLRALMGNTDLGTMSVFMDRQKDALELRVPGSREWHYDNRPVCDAGARRADYCPGGDCASVQITRHYQRLIDPHSSRDERRLAVHVLVHLVGDIHQPLHASDHGDGGGNGIKVSFRRADGRERRTNLHSAWDTDFVRAAFKTQDERRIAQGLVSQVGAADIRAMQKGTATQWIAESYAMAQDSAYGRLPGFACGGDGGPSGFAADRLHLGPGYVTTATGLVPKQLIRAGARIAHVLNLAFAKQPAKLPAERTAR